MTAPRITAEAVEDAVVAVQYHHFPGTRQTVCCLTLRNGFTVIGESSCVSDDLFNAAVGRDLAREAAKDKVWMLLGYELRNRLVEAIGKKESS
jgi:hypothetical protein